MILFDFIILFIFFNFIYLFICLFFFLPTEMYQIFALLKHAHLEH